MKVWPLVLPVLLPFAPQEAASVPADLLEQVVSAHGAGDLEAAQATLDVLLEDAMFARLLEARRAEVRYAHGVVLAARAAAPADPLFPPPELLAAAPPFESARALAGPGVLRLHATYNLGGVHLLEGERLRATLPEIAAAGQPGMPAPTTAPVPPALPPGDATGEGADPLERAKAAYTTAREHLIERLRADWRDEDTRANLELIQRRLAELDEIEEQRQQEQEEQQQEEDQDPQGEEGEGEEGENQESEEPSEEEDSEGEDPSESGSEPEDQPRQPQGGEQPTETEETQPSEDGGEAQSPADPAELQERHLTREEVMRLLDRLAELEEQREALEEALRESERVPVPRDW